jgi:hypothetical protein
MRKILRILPVILVVAALAWAGGDPWKSKPYQSWDKQDALKVLNDSPWSKVVTVSALWKGAGVGGAMPAGTEEGGSGPEGPPHANNPYGMGGGSGSQGQPSGGGPEIPAVPLAKFEARWASSRVIREAAVRLQVLSGALTEAQAEQMVAQGPAGYQVWLVGTDMAPFEKLEENTLKRSAYLEMKKAHERVPAAAVEIQRSNDGKLTALIYSFPRTLANGQPAIPANEKQVEFACGAGRDLTLKFNFDLTRMADQKGKDL